LRSVGDKALHFLFGLITQGFDTGNVPILAHALVDYVGGYCGALVGRYVFQNFIRQENLIVSNHDDCCRPRLVVENTMGSSEDEDEYQADY
jgi:hypothetical protein